MTEPQSLNLQDQPNHSKQILSFGEEVFVSEAGFSFQPIDGFEVEVDGSVYMYSVDGNLEAMMIGGELEPGVSIVDLNDDLAADFLANFDEFQLIELGKELIQGYTGYQTEIHFYNADEEGAGQALICSPHDDQFFFMMAISSLERWEQEGKLLFSELKKHIHFHQQFTSKASEIEFEKYPDLTNEVFKSIAPDEDLIINIEKEDVSLLLAVRAFEPQEKIWITDIIAPGGETLYHYDPSSNYYSSSIIEHPIFSTFGEACVYLPGISVNPLKPGGYRFSFGTSSGKPIKEIQTIIRHGRVINNQVINLNLWLALNDERFNDEYFLKEFEANLSHAITEQLKPVNLSLGSLASYYPAPDELEPFSSIDINQELADCSYIIEGSVENGRALNVGLVDQFTERGKSTFPSQISISSGSPGMILSSVSPHACILVNYSAIKNNFTLLAGEILKQLAIFTGFQPMVDGVDESQPFALSQELAQRMKRHPIFYSAD